MIIIDGAIFPRIVIFFVMRLCMDWKALTIPQGSKLFKQRNFTYIHKGVTYTVEVDEYHDGSFVGHGENATDKSSIIESVSGKSVAECVNKIISKINERG